MPLPTIQNPFTSPFLADFVLTRYTLPFTDKEIVIIDQELAAYEQAYFNVDIEKHLISKNELLASFGISKAENSTLTLEEAKSVYECVLSDQALNFISKKLKIKQTLNQKDYEKLEFFNIAKTLRRLQATPLHWSNLTPEFIRGVHAELTRGLDVFQKFIPQFDVYKSGEWRQTDTVRVGEYTPAPHTTINSAIKELVNFVIKHKTPTSIAIFHTALYALHPFANGNKRVCRVLEHLLLKLLGLNQKNLYSTSYYYHLQKPRYYKYLLASLTRKNLNHFTSFVQEALVLAIIGVAKTSVEAERHDFLTHQKLSSTAQTVLHPLIKHQEIQFKNLIRFSRGKVSRQTFVSILKKSVAAGIISKRTAGKVTYYSLQIKPAMETVLKKWIEWAQKCLPYLPPTFQKTI